MRFIFSILLPPISVRLLCQLFFQFGRIIRQFDSDAARFELADPVCQALQLLCQTHSPRRDRFGRQKAGQDAVLFRVMSALIERPADSSPPSMISSSIYQFADEFETYRRLVNLFLVFATRSTRCDVATLRATPSVPAAAFGQVICQNRDQAVRRDELAVAVNNPESVAVAVGRESQREILCRLRLPSVRPGDPHPAQATGRQTSRRASRVSSRPRRRDLVMSYQDTRDPFPRSRRMHIGLWLARSRRNRILAFQVVEIRRSRVEIFDRTAVSIFGLPALDARPRSAS